MIIRQKILPSCDLGMAYSIHPRAGTDMGKTLQVLVIETLHSQKMYQETMLIGRRIQAPLPKLDLAEYLSAITALYCLKVCRRSCYSRAGMVSRD